MSWLLVAAAAVQLMTADELGRLTAPPPDARVAYGNDPLQVGELRLPDGSGPHPVAIVIHGGCWLAQYDMTHIGSLAEALAAEGIAAWVLEYRRVGNPGGGWPGTFEDVAAGADYLRTLARDFPLDLERVVAVGHSAGGQLALWLAARGRLAPDQPLHTADPLPVRGVVALAPAADLAYLHGEGSCQEAVGGLMGGSPDEFPERYAAGSPAQLVPAGVPQRIVLGRHDTNWTPVGWRYFEAAKAEGAEVQAIDAEASGHFEMIDPGSSTWPLVRDAVRDLLH